MVFMACTTFSVIKRNKVRIVDPCRYVGVYSQLWSHTVISRRQVEEVCARIWNESECLYETLPVNTAAAEHHKDNNAPLPSQGGFGSTGRQRPSAPPAENFAFINLRFCSHGMAHCGHCVATVSPYLLQLDSTWFKLYKYWYSAGVEFYPSTFTEVMHLNTN